MYRTLSSVMAGSLHTAAFLIRGLEWCESSHEVQGKKNFFAVCVK